MKWKRRCRRSRVTGKYVAPVGGEPRSAYTCGSVSFCRGWCRITLPFPSTNSTHVECTRKPSYTLSHTHTHADRKKLGGKDWAFALPWHLRRDDTRQLLSSLVSLMASSSLLQLVSISHFFLSPSPCGRPSMTYS